MKAFSGFKSTSGMVKAIVLLNGKVFTGHQDGKIRVWTLFDDKPTRLGYLPKTKHLLLKSLSPRSYVKVKRNRNVPWIKHYDAISCMSVDEYHGLLYSGSWDKTLKIWRISDSKCLESVAAPVEVVFTGSADGTLKAWRREFVGRRTEHFLDEAGKRRDGGVRGNVGSGWWHAAVC
ncbi:hypothetical protein SASPL_104528 [Salvia splendens]|uniref:Uncharacterized protein n=1 Tax=Salvia splendens TaxID=180675 RepID=A0A8X8YMZ4_SALSN|nr:hypothetical protein SASPL_104528 [Salvia splendens]